MAYYKITSLTSKLGKRHIDKDMVLKISYRDGFDSKEHSLAPGGTLYISSRSLPVNLHKLRMKKLVGIVEIDKNVFMKLTKPQKSVVLPTAKKVEAKLLALDVVEPQPKKKRTYKKKEVENL